MFLITGYDSHLIIKNLKKQFAAEEIKIIPCNSERYISIIIGQKRFVDTLQFLPVSLDTLVTNLKKEGIEKFYHTRRHFKGKEDLIIRKGVYPYEYMNGVEKFSETELPPIEAFFSKLSDSEISEEDYEHAKTVWAEFNLKTMEEFHNVYLKSDVLFLADVFESFRKSAFETYGLDPAHFFTIPGFSFSACLKYTDVKLELLTDENILLKLEGAIRGGVSSIMKRYSRANNKYMGANYNPEEPSTYILYLDCNNLYGCSLSDYLPTGGLRFLSDDEMREFNLNAVTVDSEDGYILEVDLDYPAHLHDMHNCYPLAADHLTVTPEMYSPYAKELLAKLGKTSASSDRKTHPKSL